MGIERERKFIFDIKAFEDEGYKLEDLKSKYIIQYYEDNPEDENTEVRYRMKKSKDKIEYVKTIKSTKFTNNGKNRDEDNKNITKEQFEKSLKKCTDYVEKTRYYFELEDGKIAELDVIDNFKYNLGEVEFKTDAESKNFSPPSWFIKEVTGEERYKNRNIAKKC